MKASELRIGNELFSGKVVEITEDSFIIFDGYRKWNSKIMIEDWGNNQPKEVTDYLLLRLGFYKLAPIKSEHWYTERYGIELDLCGQPYWLEFHFPKSSNQPTSKNEIILISHLNRKNQIKIKWGSIALHQLQNIYLDLTGKQLTFKNETK